MSHEYRHRGLFLRALEGAFVSYWPTRKVLLNRQTEDSATHDDASDIPETEALFEVALCRECGQHYLVGPKNFTEGSIAEPVRDPASPEYGASFYRPIDDDAENDEANSMYLCGQCGYLASHPPLCGHDATVLVAREATPENPDRPDQMCKCGTCGYTAGGRDPVRELLHGSDGPNAVIASALWQRLSSDRNKILAFADGRQSAAYFAWYLENSHREILSRQILLQSARSTNDAEGLSPSELAVEVRDLIKQYQLLSPAAGGRERLRAAWNMVYREFLTEESRLSLEGVGLAQWRLVWPPWIDTPPALLHPPWSFPEEEARNLMFLVLDMMRADGAVELHTEQGINLSWEDLCLQKPQQAFCIGPPAGQPNMRSWDTGKGKRVSFLAKVYEKVHGTGDREVAISNAVEAVRSIWQAVADGDANGAAGQDRLFVIAGAGRRLNPIWWRLQAVGDESEMFVCGTCGRLQKVSVRDVCLRHGCPGALHPVKSRDMEINHYGQLYMANPSGRMRVEEHTAQLSQEKAREYQRDFRDGHIHLLSCSTTFELGVDLGDLDTIFLRNVPPEAFNYAQRVGRCGRRSGSIGFAITYCKRGSHDLYHFADPERMLSGKTEPPVLKLSNLRIIYRHATALALSFFFKSQQQRFTSVAQLIQDFETPKALSDFSTFLRQNKDHMEQALRHILPYDVVDTFDFAGDGWMDEIAGAESRLAMAEKEVASDYQSVTTLELSARDAREYKTADWAQGRAQTIARENVLSFLSTKAVIPKYGFPVDVVQLDTQRIQRAAESFEVSLNRDLSLAISEFAPTSRLVANKKEWTSYGLKRVAGKEWPRKHYRRCHKHSVFVQWNEGDDEPTLPCQCHDQARTYIIPQFGFVTNRDRPGEPSGAPQRVFSTRPYFAGLVAAEAGSIQEPSDRPVVTIERSAPGKMVVLCEGYRGQAFYVCESCGAGFRQARKPPHKSHFNAECRGTLNRVSLGHEFVTDVLRIQFHLPPPPEAEGVAFAFSLAFAIVEGAAETLEVPSVDLNSTIIPKGDGAPPTIVIYDCVPGGAGLASQLESIPVLRKSFATALKRVSGSCGCSEDSSCYGCLRSYRNQFAHPNLNRGWVKRYLESVLASFDS